MRTYLKLALVLSLSACAVDSEETPRVIGPDIPGPRDHKNPACTVDALEEAAGAWCFRRLECGILQGIDVDACMEDLIEHGVCASWLEGEACREAIQDLACGEVGEYPAACWML